MITALDTNILLDLYVGPKPQRDRSLLAMAHCADDGPLVCSTVVFAEFAARFAHEQELNGFLQGIAVECDALTKEAAFQGGAAHARYRRAGGTRSRILADFLIAGHAMTQADRLLTRDRGFFREYFRGLNVIEP